MKISHFNLLFAVCHPDDEAIWCGGMLYEFSRFPFIKCHVVCLSGKDENSRREREFADARTIAQYESGTVLGYKLRKASDPLPPIADTLQAGLEKLGLKTQDIDLVITHSPYGDEHKHPHHSQAHDAIKRWAKKRGVNFAFFSCLPLTHLRSQSILMHTRRSNSFQILNFSKCYHSPSWLFYLFGITDWQMKTRPKYYLQFLTDLDVKMKMLACYKSVDPELFRLGYATYTNPCENLYVHRAAGLAPFLRMFSDMSVEGSPVIFSEPVLLNRIRNRLKRLF